MRKWLAHYKKRVQIALYLFVIFLVLMATPMYGNIAARVEKITSADVLLIDAGHGGMDGGAQSAGGTPEKDINLAISKEIQALAEADGWRVVMTREEDKGLYKQQEGRTIRSMKTEDLRARKDIIDQTKPNLTVSVHLNSFKEDRSVHGAQVFYPAGQGEGAFEESKKLAEMIQQELEAGIDDGKERTAMGKRDVLILKQPQTPIVIVECGFLSNYEEAKLLETEEYQKKLAECIYRGIMKYTGKDAQKNVTVIDSADSDTRLK